MSVVRNSADINNIQSFNKFETWWGNNPAVPATNVGTQRYQLKINNQFYPQVAVEVVNGNPQGYWEMLRLLGNYNGYDESRYASGINTNYFDNKMVLAVNVAPHQNELLSGLNTATNYSTILLQITTAGVLPGNMNVDSFVVYDSVMYIDARTGKVRKYD